MARTIENLATAFAGESQANRKYLAFALRAEQDQLPLVAMLFRETYEFTEMYPAMVEQAMQEGHKGRKMLEYANAAEQVHARLFRQALEAIKAGKDLSMLEVYLCPFCGNIELGVPEERCPICNEPSIWYRKILATGT